MQRCRAKSKRSGKRCKNYAIKGYSVCRMHGARGGPKSSEGRLRCKAAALKHGFYTEQAILERREMSKIATTKRVLHCPTVI